MDGSRLRCCRFILTAPHYATRTAISQLAGHSTAAQHSDCAGVRERARGCSRLLHTLSTTS
eukprot:5377281-Pleurochrysis_carterae.AAC.1